MLASLHNLVQASRLVRGHLKMDQGLQMQRLMNQGTFLIAHLRMELSHHHRMCQKAYRKINFQPLLLHFKAKALALSCNIHLHH